VVLVLLSVPLLGQKLSAGSIAGTLLSFSGVALLALMGRKAMDVPPGPLALALLSTLIWAVYWLLNTRNRGGVNAVLLVSFCFGTLYLAVYGALRGHSFALPGRALPWIAYIGVFEMGLTYILWNTALRTASSTASVGNMVFLAPFVSLIPIMVVVGETIAPSTIAGLVLVTGGILIEKRFRSVSPMVSPEE
jgi:drug/metabolite transporter (DMT)-like permease